MRRTGGKVRAAVAVALLLVVVGCSSDDGASPPEDTGGTSGTTEAPSTLVRADGPAADLSEELTGGAGVFLGAAEATTGFDDVGYVEEELVAAGTATSYTAEELPADGRYELEEADEADYRTRIVVRRPESPDDFNGTVVVEWLNVSGGVDANPDYTFMEDELLRGGYAWVGVSAQAIGVEGGPVAVTVDIAEAEGVAGEGLKSIDPERYGSLEHPGDAYAYDLYTQVGRALRAPGTLGDLEPERILAVGESQSAFLLTTYVNGVQPLTGTYDGFLIHSRGGAAGGLGEGGGAVDISSAIAGEPTIIRTDTEVPVLIVETETDLVSVLSYYPARQDDTDRIRLWEVAGTAHADRNLLGATADALDCGVPINDGPQDLVIRAGVRALDRWVRSGEPPPDAVRLEIEEGDAGPVIVRDEDGIAMGGIRTAPVDVPVAALTGEPGPNPSIICLLLGSTVPFSDERIAELYPDQQAYLDAFEAATDEAIAAGFVLEEDREAALEDARPDLVGG